MTQIIGLVGFKQSGKSTAAQYLQDKYGFVRHNMKDHLIAEIKQNFPDLLQEIGCIYWDVNRMELAEEYPMWIDKLFQEKPSLMRALMVNYGTEVRRRQDKNYWVKAWLATPVFQNNIVTDDVRFLNEAQAIKRNGGILVRIIRTDITTGGDHESETQQLQIEADYTIEVGPGEQEKLYAELDAILAKWKEADSKNQL